MSAIELACEGCTLKFTNTSHTGSILIAPIGVGGSTGSKAKCRVNDVDNQVYVGVKFTVSGASNGAGITAGTGTGTITGSATKVKVSGQPPVRKGDCVTIIITGVQSGSPATYSSELEVDDPGQTKAKAV